MVSQTLNHKQFTENIRKIQLRFLVLPKLNELQHLGDIMARKRTSKMRRKPEIAFLNENAYYQSQQTIR